MKRWQTHFLPEQLRRFFLGDVKDHLILGEVFESEDSESEEDNQVQETERPLVIDPTEGEFPVISKTINKLMIKEKSEVPKRTGFENLITDDGIELVNHTKMVQNKVGQQPLKGFQNKSPNFKQNKSIHVNAGSGTTKFEIDSPNDRKFQAKQKSKSFLQVPPSRFSKGIKGTNLSIRSGSPVKKPELLPLPKQPQVINVETIQNNYTRIATNQKSEKRETSKSKSYSPTSKNQKNQPKVESDPQKQLSQEPQQTKVAKQNNDNKVSTVGFKTERQKLNVSDLSDVVEIETIPNRQTFKQVRETLEVFRIDNLPVNQFHTAKEQKEPMKDLINKNDKIIETIDVSLLNNKHAERSQNHDHSDQKVDNPKKPDPPKKQEQRNIYDIYLQQQRSKTPEIPKTINLSPIVTLTRYLQKNGIQKANDQGALQENQNQKQAKIKKQRIRDSTASFGRSKKSERRKNQAFINHINPTDSQPQTSRFAQTQIGQTKQENDAKISTKVKTADETKNPQKQVKEVREAKIIKKDAATPHKVTQKNENISDENKIKKIEKPVSEIEPEYNNQQKISPQRQELKIQNFENRICLTEEQLKI